MVRIADGRTVEQTVERINYRECLTPFRAFYLDLAHWAVEDPARWGPWVAPSPVGEEEIDRKKAHRRRKARMDARTRERLPALPTLARNLDRRHKTALTLLQAARGTPPEQPFAAEGINMTRSRVDPRTRADRIWADDPATGKRRDLTREEDHAFWSWAIVEVLRATGIRVEELTELSHYSLVQYKLPDTGELVPLLQIAPSKTDAERLLVVSPDLADVLAAIIFRHRDKSGAVPLVAAYDTRKRVWSTPTPFLFQRRIGGENHAIPVGSVGKLLTRALAECGPRDHAGQPMHYTPHDVHHRRDPQRPAAAHRAGDRRPPGHQRHHGLQGRLPRRGDPSPPGVPGPPPWPAAQRRIPRPDRRRVGGSPRPLAAAQGLHLAPAPARWAPHASMNTPASDARSYGQKLANGRAWKRSATT